MDVAFPYLERALVDHTGRLPAHFKLRGTSKRYLFKRALDDILPEAIRKKKKQGFGLPISVWLARGGRYQQWVADTLGSRTMRERGLVRAPAVQALLDRHRRGAWDHAAELHILAMLEQWHRLNVDGVE